MASILQELSKDMADLVEGAAQSVLRVDARRRIPASGIAWAEDLIVTAHHVVERDDDISIGLPDGGRLSAELVGRDPRYDLALLRTEAALQPVARAEADLSAGNIVLALGRPAYARQSLAGHRQRHRQSGPLQEGQAARCQRPA